MRSGKALAPASKQMVEQRKSAEWFGTVALAIFVIGFFFGLWVLSLRHAAQTLGDVMVHF